MLLVTLQSSVFILDIRILHLVAICSEYFSLNVNDMMCGNVSTRLVNNICLGRRTEESYCNVIGVFELLMLKRNILAVPGCDFTVRDIDLLTQSMCNDLC